MILKLLLLVSLSFANTGSLTFEPPQKIMQGREVKDIDPQEVVDFYLEENAKKFGVEKDFENIELVSRKESLLAYHFYFQQIRDDFKVEGAGISVSVSKKDNSILKTYSTLKPKAQFTALTKKLISSNRAIDKAWNFIKVHGDVLAIPKAERLYFLHNSKYILGYKVTLSVAKPLGEWLVYVSSSGKVLDFQNLLTPTKRALDRDGFRAYTGAVLSRQTAEEKFYSRKKLPQKTIRQTNGSGYSFLPDPRTTLKNDGLRDDSAAELFEPAYIQIDLNDITQKEDGYHLEGPYVKLVDFDFPYNDPVISQDGQWNFKRGHNGFNDSMTYYTIDKSQRYLQSLGFVDDKGIQQGQITVDTDGVNGGDNSYYIPSENALSFGHGCVDDNEDADVILHEYGHAIQYSINKNWEGGDTRAIGEGFGDYWAASYSVRMKNGREYHTNRVFTWDGLFECWDGRRLDAVGAMYDHSKTYYDHQYIPGGYISDELWSTPLFQSLLEALNSGLSHQEVDTIILEAHFGLGSDIKMRDMANSIVKTAELLYPTKSYADIFQSNFEKHKILEPQQFSFTKDSFNRLIGKIKSFLNIKTQVGKNKK